MRHHIVVTQPVHDEVRRRLTALGDVTINPGPEPWSPAELGRHLAQADAMIGFMTDRVDAAVLAAAPRLRHIACALKGADNYDLSACAAAGVGVSLVPDLLTAPTAELALGLAIGLGRHLREGDGRVRSGAFLGWRPTLYGQGFAGRTVVIVGLGAVGRAIARRLDGFDCTLIGVDPGAAAPAGVSAMTLTQALPLADWVMLAAPRTPDTLHLIGDAQIDLAPRHTLWVNVGRGSVVDEAAMAEALWQERTGGYAADVFAFEDWAQPGRPEAVPPRLLSHPRTLFTPHLGSAVADVRVAIEHQAVDAVEAALSK